MKFRCERDVLLDAVSGASRATSPRGSMPILGGLRLGVAGDLLTVTGTDIDLTISVEATVDSRQDGIAVAPARLTTDIVRSFDPGAVEVEADDEDLTLISGRSRFTVRTHQASDFPRIAAPTKDATVSGITGLSEALRQVTRAASSDDGRPILTGVLIAAEGDGLRLVATDSYRLALRDLPGVCVLGEGQKVLIPSRALNELQRLLSSSSDETTLRLGDHDASFAVGHATLTTRLIEGDFPDYRVLIPSDYPNRLVVGRESLLDALRRVKLLARDATTPVRMALRPASIELAVVTNDWGAAVEEVEAKYEGSEMTVAFNPTYLIEGVEVVTGDEVCLDTLDALKPAVLRPVGSDDYLYLLMPVRVP